MSADATRKVWTVAAIAAPLATVFVPRPDNVGIWLHTLFEWLHVPVFGLVSLALLALTPNAWETWQRFGPAFVGALVLGVLSEAVQIPMSRDASLEDILSDAAGAAGFLLVAYSVGRKPAVAILSAAAALAILISSALPLISVSQAIVQRNSQFPVIFNGDIDSEKAFVSGRNVRMETRWARSLGRLYTRVEVVRGRGPAIDIRELVADWSEYSVLRLEIENESEANLQLTVRIHDKLHRRGSQPHSDRFNQRLTLPPGHNSLSIALQDVTTAPRDRLMDMTDIDALVIFSNEDDAERVFRLYEIRLD